jgi:hypothetical protein
MFEPPQTPAYPGLTAAGRLRILPQGPGLAGRPCVASRPLSPPLLFQFFLPLTLPCLPR